MVCARRQTFYTDLDLVAEIRKLRGVELRVAIFKELCYNRALLT